MRMPGGSSSRVWVFAYLLVGSLANAQIFYWNPSAPLLNGSAEAQKAYNWTATAAGGGVYPKSSFDDDFSANSIGTAWTFRDADSSASTGTGTIASGQLTLSGRGADVWLSQNQFTGVYRSDITGDFDVSVKVVSQSSAASTHEWAKAGIMMRNNIAAGAADSGGFAIVAVTPSHGVTFQYDTTGNVGGLDGYATSPSVTLPCWIRMAKSGTSVTGYYRTDSTKAWTQVGGARTPQSTAANSKIALFASSHDATKTTTAVFDDFAGGGNISATGLDLRFGIGTGAQAAADARLTADLSARSVAFAGATVGFDFLAATLTVSDSANFSAAKSVAAGTGALAFVGNGAQKLVPRANDTLPALSKSGNGALTIAVNPAVAGKLTLSGSLNCGGLNQEFAGLAASGGSIIGLDAADTLTFSGDANFASLTALPTAGAIQLRAVSNTLAFTPGTAPFNDLILWPRPLAGDAAIAVKAGALDVRGSLIVRDEKIGASSAFSGKIDFKAGSPDVTLAGALLSALAGASSGVNSLILDMGKGTWAVKGDVNLALPAGLIADSATLDFKADAPAVQSLSIGTDSLGAVRHSGTGTVNLALLGQPFKAGSFSQSSGVLNLNGSNLIAAGDLTIANGSAGSIVGLEGRELKAGGNISLSGTSAARLGLNTPGKTWKATAGGSLVADWADLSGSDAGGSASAGAATANCLDNGRNVHWNFETSPPSFVLQPASKSVLAGKPVVFKAKAAGSTPIAYEWRKAGDTATVLSTIDSLIIPIVDLSQNGSAYYCTATNSVGSVRSLDAVLTVVTAPLIDVQPADSSVVAGKPVSFTVAAHGTAPLQYAWRKTGDAGTVLGTGPTLSLDSATAALDGASFACTVTNAYGNVVSRAAVLTLKYPPKITRQPASATGTAGLKASFSIGATGTKPLAFAWTRANDTAVLSTDSVLTLGPLALADSDSYVCQVSNPYGTAASQPAKLTVVQAATIAREPADVSVGPGRKAVFIAGVEGAKPLAYAWRRKGDTTVISRDTLLAIDSVKLKDNGSIFVFTVSNAYGADTSREAKLTVVTCDSVFKVAPETLTVDEGQPAVVAGTAACSVARRWAVISGPAPRILDPEVDTLAFIAPRLAADTALVLSFSAQYGEVWPERRAIVKIREAIPDPKFTLPKPGKWTGTRTYVVRPTLTNQAALKASKYAPPLRYQWFLSAAMADTAQAGDSLTLSRPTQGGNLDVTLCMDNGGSSTCLVHTVDIDLATVSLVRRAARFGPVSLQGRMLDWNADADVRIWDFRGRVLWQGRGRAGASASLPEAAARDLLRGRARLEIRR